MISPKDATAPAAAPTPAPRLRMKRRSAADYLGLSLPALDALARRGKIPVIRFGPRLVLFDRIDLDQFFEAHRCGTRDSG
jgi:excisionase family DNA binding protein